MYNPYFNATLFVGTGYDKDRQELPEATVHAGLAAVRSELLANAGGFTESNVIGGWDDNGTPVIESAIRFDVLFTASNGQDALHKSRQWAEFAALALNQASVALAVTPAAVEFVEQKERINA